MQYCNIILYVQTSLASLTMLNSKKYVLLLVISLPILFHINLECLLQCFWKNWNETEKSDRTLHIILRLRKRFLRMKFLELFERIETKAIFYILISGCFWKALFTFLKKYQLVNCAGVILWATYINHCKSILLMKTILAVGVR